MGRLAAAGGFFVAASLLIGCLGGCDRSSDAARAQVEIPHGDERLIVEHLEKRERARGEAPYYCAVHTITRADDGAGYYGWAACSQWRLTRSGALLEGSSSSAPAVIRIRGDRVAVRMPGDGSRFEPDVRRLFPDDVMHHILRGMDDPCELHRKTLVRARAALKAPNARLHTDATTSVCFIESPN